MKIGTLISVFNGEQTLERTLLSIENQTVKADEIIIVNDGSTDGTRALIERWMGRLPITLIENKKNKGIVYSLNRGLKISKSDWIFRIDADDSWLSNHIESLMRSINSSDEPILVSSRAFLIDNKNNLLGISKELKSEDIPIKLMWDNPLIQSATAFDRKLCQQIGGYKSVKWEDYDLWIRLLSRGKGVFLNSVTVNYSVLTNSTSRINFKSALLNRWVCQKLAIRSFFFVAPILAIFFFFIGIARILWIRVKN